MKPTIGRVVLFSVNRKVDYPAVIVRVWSDGCVNLKVFTDYVGDSWKANIKEGTEPGTWRWPVIKETMTEEIARPKPLIFPATISVPQDVVPLPDVTAESLQEDAQDGGLDAGTSGATIEVCEPIAS